MDPEDITVTDSSSITNPTITTASSYTTSRGDTSSSGSEGSSTTDASDTEGTSGGDTSGETTGGVSTTGSSSGSSDSSTSDVSSSSGSNETTGGSYCGDGVVDPGEECDTDGLDPYIFNCDQEMVDPQIPELGFKYKSNPTKATFPCTEFCFIDKSYCKHFMDGIITDDDSILLKFAEPCDQKLPTPTCVDLGYKVPGSAVCVAIPENGGGNKTIFRNVLDETPCMP